MKTQFLIRCLLVTILFPSLTVSAQTWYKGYGNSNYNAGLDVATDAGGNIYSTGYYQGTINFSTTTLAGKGNEDVFLAKWDNNGNLQWAKGFGSVNQDEGLGIYTDPAGNSYITGFFFQDITFGSIALSTFDGTMFLAKFDPSGNCLWAHAYGGSGDCTGYSLCSDGTNLYAAGYFSKSASFGSISLTSNGLTDGFVMKFMPDGTPLWAKKIGGNGDDKTNAITYNNGNLFLTGSFNNSISLGSTTLTSSGGRDMYLAKLDTAGNYAWAKQGGGVTNDVGKGIAVDAGGNVYVGGSFTNNAVFGTTTYTANSSSNLDQYYAKFDGSGAFVSLYHTQMQSDVKDLLVDAAGRILLTGDGYTPSTGDATQSVGLAFDNHGDIISTGAFRSNGGLNWNVYVAKYTGNHTNAVRTISGNSLRVYPNPVSEAITVEGLKKGQCIDIRNITGQLMMSRIASASIEKFTTLSLMPGTYFISVDGLTIQVVKY